MSHMDDAITIKPINTKQLFRCNFTQFANSNVSFHRPQMDSGPTTLPAPNFLMYNQDQCQLNDDNRLNHLNKSNENRSKGINQSLNYIPAPPPMPANNQNQPSSLLINNTYTIKRELRNNHHFLAQSNNETNSLNFMNSSHLNNANIKLRKKSNLEKSNQLKSNSMAGQFENSFNNNNLTSLNNCNQTPINLYPIEQDDQQDSSLPEFQNYSIQHVDLPNQSNNNFFSLPYHQVNFNPQQYNQQETCVKYPQINSQTVDRQNNGQRNCVNNHCASSHKKFSSAAAGASNNFLNSTTEFSPNQSENFNNNNNLSNSIEDLRNESASKQINDRTLQPNLISALRTSISAEKQRLYKEQLRNELALKLKINKNAFQSQTNNLSSYLFRKKPKYKFFSQLYFLFHISFTLCLFKVSEIDKENSRIYGDILNFYFGYLLATAIMFLLALRCCKYQNLNKEFKLKNTSIVSFGCISLGLIQLITIGLDLVNCINSDLIFLPILHSSYVFLLMYFILTQAKESNKYFYNNVAIAHLFLTQLSIWLSHFKQRGTDCGYFQITLNELQTDLTRLLLPKDSSSLLDEKLLLLNDTLADDTKNIPTILQNLNVSTSKPFMGDKLKDPIESKIQAATASAIQFTSSNATSTFSLLLMPIIHHFQILTIFILISIWLNNNKTKMNYHQKTRLCETESINCFNETEFVSTSFLNKSTKLKSIKGFFLGLLTISTTIVVLTTANDYFLIATHSIIQMLCVVITLFALLVKGKRRKGLQKLPQKMINKGEFHMFVVTSLICAYFCSFSAIILNLTQKALIIENLIDSFLLLIQITLQTILLRSDGRNFDKMRDIHAFLIFANFSLYLLEITEIASINGTNYNLFNLNVLPQIIVSLNRFYSSLLCIHFLNIKSI